MAPSNLSLQLYVEPSSDPIAGSLVYPDGHQLAFSGWIELTAALEDARLSEILDVMAQGEERGAHSLRDGSSRSQREDTPAAVDEPSSDRPSDGSGP